MPLIIIAGMVLLAFLAIWLGFVPPPHASTLIRIHKGGAIYVKRGQLKPHAREHVTEILGEAGVSSGFIAITPDNRVAFSRRVPSTIHQRLRNVLLNQWA